MVEARIAPRVARQKPFVFQRLAQLEVVGHERMKAAKTDYGGDKYPCTVRDISTTGAALDFPDLLRIPDQFTLIMPEDRLKLPCHVVWRRKYRSRIRFRRAP